MAEHEQIDFEDELRRYHRADPFVPFDIVVTSGDRYPITQYDQVAFGGNTVVVVLPKTGIRFFRKNQIVAVHVHELSEQSLKPKTPVCPRYNYDKPSAKP